jgi:cell division protein ZapA (FtsZ GTPase activity inhibitor)
MQENDLKTITVAIAGRNFPVKVTDIEETMVRDLEQELNDKVTELQNTYPSRDKLDCVIMTLLTYSFDQKKSSVDIIPDIANQKIDKIKGLLQQMESE